MLNRKLRQRLVLVIANSANILLVPVVNIAVSLLVIRLASAELWGAFVSILIWINLANHIIHWGSKEYLLREFSRRPGSIGEAWQSNLLSRAGLYALFVLAVLLFPIPPLHKLLVILWGGGAMLFQSCESLVLYRRKFSAALLLEMSTILLMVGIILLRQDDLSIELLMLLFASAYLLKFAGLAYLFRRDIFAGLAGTFQPAFFRIALPFFLLGFTGMLQSRTDLYCVAYFLDHEKVGQYQVFINMLIYIQVFASMILQPFLKNIYRLGSGVLKRISLRLFGLGAAITLPALGGIYLLLNQVYGFPVGAAFLFWGGLFVLPIYYYLPQIYLLYKLDLQSKVLYINLLGIMANLLLNVCLIPGFGLLGAIAASALSQWLMLLAYRYVERRWLGGRRMDLDHLPVSSRNRH